MTNLSPIVAPRHTGLYKRQVAAARRCSTRKLIVPAIWASFNKLDPRTLVKNPVMFCVEIVSVLTTIFFLRDLFVGASKAVGSNALFSGQITLWLWFTVLFANFAEAVAEGRGKAQADTLAPHAHRDQGQALDGAQARDVRPRRRRGAASRAISCWSRPAT